MQWIKNLLGGGNGEIKRLTRLAERIDTFEDAHRGLDDAAVRALTAGFKERLERGEPLDDLLPEAFSAAREAMGRAIGKRHFHVQMLGGIVLHQGRVAEMKTGEGKTFVAVLPAYLNALTGKGVHIVTVNDYLAKFQGEWMAHIFRFLGMEVGIIVHDKPNDARRKAYAADVTYGTNNELGFDYLRDNMVIYKDQRVQRGHAFAIVDEADSILIDEARTPLIISGQGEASTDWYKRAHAFVERLRPDEDFTRDEKEKAINLTEAGAAKAERYFSVDNLSDMENTQINHHIMAALRANHLMRRDTDYVVQDGQVIIVDEFTGRLMLGRRYSDGLHQAIEAKENVKVEHENKTLATITFQNYFRMYSKLSGMTGTAKTEEEEFKGIYKLDVVQIPPNKPMIRRDLNDMVYTSEKGKYEQAVKEIARRHATGQPILVGTVSVEKSEILSRMLELEGLDHEVLNAKHHAKEAEIVAQAGHYGAVTIATNMAGRGTDILLGGNPEFLARRELRKRGVDDDVIEQAVGHEEDVPDDVRAAREQFVKLEADFHVQTERERQRVVEAGGLHILGTERHESRRIDNQLRGRAGRQGDPGSSQFFISLEDDLMRLFGSERVAPMIERLGLKPDEPIEAGLLTRQIENAQKRIEGRNFDIRKHVLQYDDVMNQQRGVIYGQRGQVLDGVDMRGQVLTMLRALIDDAVKQRVQGDDPDNWDLAGLGNYLERFVLAPGMFAPMRDGLLKMERADIAPAIEEASRQLYEKREKAIADIGANMREIERVELLNAVDHRWMDHIDDMSRLRDGIGLRALGHHDPVVEYKFEGFEMFDEMVRLIREDTLQRLFLTPIGVRVQRRAVPVPPPPDAPAPDQPRQQPQPRGYGPRLTPAARPAARPTAASAPQPNTPVKAVPKVGRNEPCPCGSGKKYKHCHGKEA
ncbi:MAG: preprotein translocase subunit SecA [Oscillospiraceae bacterium]|jgi:preprotein translocase subunit SecA|nr:preprotein translocase subunit SecA [Oscillospiraceae bacterium]